MTARRRTLDQIEPLSLDNKVGDGVPAMEDLIQTQNAILQSNAAVLGAVQEFRTGIDGRLDRQLGQINDKVDGIDVKLETVCTQVDTIKVERRVEAALAVDRAKNEADHAATAMTERHEQTARIEGHSVSMRWRVTIGVAVGIPAFAQLWPVVVTLARRI